MLDERNAMASSKNLKVLVKTHIPWKRESKFLDVSVIQTAKALPTGKS